MRKDNNLKKNKIIPYVILGAGPGGLQLAYYFEQNNIDYLILEKSDNAGNTFEYFPRHRKLISINKIHTGFDNEEINMRYDWNSLLSEEMNPLFKTYSDDYFPNADKIVQYFQDYANLYNLKISYNSEVINIKKINVFSLETKSGQTYLAEKVIIATGLFKPYLPNIRGIKTCDTYVNCSVDPKDFINKRVLIIGKGNSGFETADNIIATASKIHICSPNSVKLAWKSHFVGNLRAVNNNLLDTYQLKSQNGVIDAEISEIILKEDGYHVSFHYSHANDEIEELIYDNVILCAGFQFDTSFFDKSTLPDLAIDDRLPKQKSNWESTNVENLFFAGTLTQMRDYKKSTSGFIHGFRYNSRCLFHMLQKLDRNIDWPHEVLERSPEIISGAIIKDVNESSTLWQQFGFLGDLMVINQNEVLFVKNIPVDYAKEVYCQSFNHYFIITLEYGNEIFEMAPDIFSLERVHRNDIENADKSSGLHPILREFKDGKLVNTHHLIEDFENKWDEHDIYFIPLLKFLRKSLNRS